MRKLLIAILAIVSIGPLDLLSGLSNARRSPVVRTASLALSYWPGRAKRGRR